MILFSTLEQLKQTRFYLLEANNGQADSLHTLIWLVRLHPLISTSIYLVFHRPPSKGYHLANFSQIVFYLEVITTIAQSSTTRLDHLLHFVDSQDRQTIVSDVTCFPISH